MCCSLAQVLSSLATACPHPWFNNPMNVVPKVDFLESCIILQRVTKCYRAFVIDCIGPKVNVMQSLVDFQRGRECCQPIVTDSRSTEVEAPQH